MLKHPTNLNNYHTDADNNSTKVHDHGPKQLPCLLDKPVARQVVDSVEINVATVDCAKYCPQVYTTATLIQHESVPIAQSRIVIGWSDEEKEIIKYFPIIGIVIFLFGSGMYFLMKEESRS